MEKTFRRNNINWYAFYSKLANFTDFEEIQVFFQKKTIYFLVMRNFQIQNLSILPGQLASKRKKKHRFEWMILLPYYKCGRKIISYVSKKIGWTLLLQSFLEIFHMDGRGLNLTWSRFFMNISHKLNLGFVVLVPNLFSSDFWRFSSWAGKTSTIFPNFEIFFISPKIFPSAHSMPDIY